jgi:hypothetical protein
MEFVLILISVCAHACSGPSEIALPKVYHSFHQCFGSGFNLLERQKAGGHAWKYKCQPQARHSSEAQASKSPKAPGALSDNSARTELTKLESGGNPKAINRFGYVGKFQFGAPLLTDLGLYRPGARENLKAWSSTRRVYGAKWSGSFHVPNFPEVRSLTDFLNSPAAQDAAFDVHMSSMERQIRSHALDRYIGRQISGVRITQTGLEMMIHLGGLGGTWRVIESGGALNPHDMNGTSLLEYAGFGARAEHGPSCPLVFEKDLVSILGAKQGGDSVSEPPSDHRPLLD